MIDSGGHVFWWLLTMACVTWYSTVTIYVAIRGASDIKKMLAHLAEDAPERATAVQPSADK
jgi:uncharacterized protein (UPF0333 family)